MQRDNPPNRDASWRFNSGPPQRYTTNFAQYRARGGLVMPLDDMRRFEPEGKGTGNSGRFWFFCLVADQLAKEGIAGDFAEVGVYKGRTAALLATIARRLDRTVYLFDTFEGFAEADIKGIDASKNQAAFADTSLEAVRAFVGEENVEYIKGYFPDSAAQIRGDHSFCCVHIDCDLHAPILSALEFFYPRVVPGGFIVVHDYSSLWWAGAEKAVDDFFADKSEAVIPLPDNSGSAVIRKRRTAGGPDNWRSHRIQGLVTDAWIKAAGGGAAPLLGAGWSNAEAWGVWGVGAVHEIEIAPVPDRGDLEIDADVHAYLPEPQSLQEVEIVVGRSVLARWTFSAAENRGVRSVRIPHDVAANALSDANTWRFKIQFRPREVHPSAKDKRLLGMALHGVRLRQLAKQDSVAG